MKLNVVEVYMVILHIMLEHLAHFASRCPAKPGLTENTAMGGCQDNFN